MSLRQPPDILATRLYGTVACYRGHTRAQMFAIACFSLVFSIIICGSLASLLLHHFLVGLGVSFPVAIPVGWCIANYWQRLKANKPPGYSKQWWWRWGAQHGFWSTPFILYSGKWTTRRNNSCNL